MKNKISGEVLGIWKDSRFRAAAAFLVVIFVAAFLFPSIVTLGGTSYERQALTGDNFEIEIPEVPVVPPLDKAEYDRRMNLMANNPPYIPKEVPDPSTSSGQASLGQAPPPPPVYPWPVASAPYPRDSRAILPFKRVIAYYGNLYSKKMGVLGEYPEDEMLYRLHNEVEKWEVADPETPVVPALHYIAVVAQLDAGRDGKHRARMPGSEIEKVLKMADKIGAIVFLDIQVGFSTVAAEVPLLEKYLKLPNVHLGLDPEFSMKGTHRPGKAVGTMNSEDINFAANYLANLVREHDLPPKILVVHRYTQNMLTGYKDIAPLPEVQMVIHMDGWGGKAKKLNTYRQFVVREPVQFTGFKIFYKNDLWEKGSALFEPEELLKLNPRPVYIQYQ